MTDTATGKGELKFLKLQILQVSFKSDMWNHFGLPVSRNENIVGVMDGQMQTQTNTHLVCDFFAHIHKFTII